MLKASEEIKAWHLGSGPVIGNTGFDHPHDIFSYHDIFSIYIICSVLFTCI